MSVQLDEKTFLAEEEATVDDDTFSVLDPEAKHWVPSAEDERAGPGSAGLSSPTGEWEKLSYLLALF